MPFAERINYAAFMENREQIEGNWDTEFGDRKIELVFIGQGIQKEEMIDDLNDCLLTDEEVQLWKTQLFP